MASPTLAEIQDQFNKALKPLNELRKWAASHSYDGPGSYKSIDVQANYLDMEDALVQALEGEYVKEKIDALLAFRSQVDVALASAPTVLYPHLRELCRFMGYPETDAQAMLTRVYEYMHDNSLSVLSRAFTFGSVSADGGNVGTGTVNRLNADENGYAIDNQTGTSTGLVKTAECYADEHSGANEHEEKFYLYGATPDRDRLKIVGVYDRQTVKALSAVDSRPFLSNPSFEEITGTDGTPFTATTDLQGWTLSTAASFTPIATSYYRDYAGCSTPRSLKIGANANVTQNLNQVRARLNPQVPMYLQLAYDRATGAGDGTLTLALGSQSVSVNLVAQTGWNILRLTLGQANWFKTWNQENPAITITLGSRTTGYVLVDDVILAPFTLFDGGWYAIVGGSTPFLRKDKFTWTDTTPTTEGIIQYWIYRAFGRYLPGADTGETWDDPY